MTAAEQLALAPATAADPLFNPVAHHPLLTDTACPTSGGQFTCLVGTIVSAGHAPFKVSWPDGYATSASQTAAAATPAGVAVASEGASSSRCRRKYWQRRAARLLPPNPSDPANPPRPSPLGPPPVCPPPGSEVERWDPESRIDQSRSLCVDCRSESEEIGMKQELHAVQAQRG